MEDKLCYPLACVQLYKSTVEKTFTCVLSRSAFKVSFLFSYTEENIQTLNSQVHSNTK